MAEWATDDLATTALCNQKMVYVGAAAPGTPYDGQHWVDINTDPPVVKVYDLTNTQWMQHHPVYYETQAGAWANPSVTPVSNGTLVVLYNSTQAGTRLYYYANSAWGYLTAKADLNHRLDSIQQMTSGAGDVTVTGGGTTTWAGSYNVYDDIVIDNGNTLSLTGQPGVIICNTLTNNGTITKSDTGGAGGGNGLSGGGGNGGGQLFIIADDFDNNATIQADGEDANDGAAAGAHAGASGTGGICIRVGADALGNGGDGGNVAAADGGGGGGSTGGSGDSAGSGGSITYQTLNSDLGMDSLWLGTSWAQWAEMDYAIGAGGCRARGDGTDEGGGGGGSGGAVFVSAVTFDNTGGTIKADGGDGGDGFTGGGQAGGGGGGGGGMVICLVNTNNGAGTVQAALGTGGSGAGGGGNGDNGVAGTAEVVAL